MHAHSRGYVVKVAVCGLDPYGQGSNPCSPLGTLVLMVAFRTEDTAAPDRYRDIPRVYDCNGNMQAS